MKNSVSLPEISRPLLRFFRRYGTGYLRRHFHSIRLLRNASPNESLEPLVIYLNHAAWWDPLVCLFLAFEFFPRRPAYGPMEAEALERYRFFKRLGFFPVESGTRRGAAQFLRASNAILARSESVLFLTPQGEFADVRATLRLAPGLEHLATRAPHAFFVPLALEYTFWEERKPEVLVAFGEALPPTGKISLVERLAGAQAALAAAAERRQPNEWRVLTKSKSGVGGPYDWWRGGRARWRGEKFQADHSAL